MITRRRLIVRGRLLKGQLTFAMPRGEVARHAAAPPSQAPQGATRQGLVLKVGPSGKKRYMRSTEPHPALKHPHARQLVGELHGAGRKGVHVTASRAGRDEIRALHQHGLIKLDANPSHYFYEHRATLTKKGRRHYRNLLDHEEEKGRQAQTGLFKARRGGAVALDPPGDMAPTPAAHLHGQEVHFAHPHTGQRTKGTVKGSGHRGITVHDDGGQVHRLHHGDYYKPPHDYGGDTGDTGADTDTDTDSPADNSRETGAPAASAGQRPGGGLPGHLDADPHPGGLEAGSAAHEALVNAWANLRLPRRSETRVVSAAALLAHVLQRATHGAHPDRVRRAVSVLQAGQVDITPTGVAIGRYALHLPGSLHAAIRNLAETAGGPHARLFAYRAAGEEGTRNLTPARLKTYQETGR